MPTRSTVLGRGHSNGGVNVTVFTVPANFTYLVKSVFLTVAGVFAETDSLQAVDALGNSALIIAPVSIQPGVKVEWDGWIALNPGDSLVFNGSGVNSYYWISGAKLPGVA